jgi:cytidyltransferase-like protein
MSKKKTLKLKPDSQAASPGKIKVARRHQKNSISKKAKLNSPSKAASSPVQVKKSASTPKKAE